ncbi:integral membrane protein DUF6 containing protein (macronuclear) [Tetrahymena thermophila SB210]|uniref:Integral membrane protein DUF6 containing protein n=1 Tax=Tetrahymena thermophila (strain SB210) TaxID=312017 RepID=Q22CG8_TETTS|nr:integral membrane protein DUF6 containing protein [Tetrahymena thermophila SB210]EAR82961.2 integral membrane protein DUF6 containing protein [Tetrahymena thermophila SB210]|eukprot:XP_001030624.2 integral membrane protein DUF6 containing protein [Tetrahymena thermophila SB210]
MKAYVDQMENELNLLTKPFYKIIKEIKQMCKNQTSCELFSLSINSVKNIDYKELSKLTLSALYYNLNQVSQKMEKSLAYTKKELDLAFQQLKNIIEAIEGKQKNKQKKSNFAYEQRRNYDDEIRRLFIFIEEQLQEIFSNLYIITKAHFKSPKNKLTLCNQIFEMNLPYQKDITQDYCKSIRSIFEQNQIQRKRGVSTNLFQENNSPLNNKAYAEKFQSETNMSAATEVQNKIANKLIQSDPQSNVFYSEKIQQKQIPMNFVSPRIEIKTPHTKNNFLNKKNQESTSNQHQLIKSNQSSQKADNQNTNINNKNAKVSYSGSFSDRAAHGEVNQMYQIFKNKLPLQINISQLSESRNINQKEEFPVFQSPNFNNNLTRENINKAFNSHSQTQSQKTTLSRQTHNIRDITASCIQNTEIDHSNSIKTRDIDPIINGSDNEGLTENYDQEILNDSFSEQFYNQKLQDLF